MAASGVSSSTVPVRPRLSRTPPETYSDSTTPRTYDGPYASLTHSDCQTFQDDTLYSYELLGKAPTGSWTTAMEASSDASRVTEPSTVSVNKPSRRRLPSSPLPSWGATRLRSNIFKKLQRPEDAHAVPYVTCPSQRLLSEELQRLMTALKDALCRLDHRRCRLILTYLLHARHLIVPEIVKGRHIGSLFQTLTTSTDVTVATCAKSALKLWRFGLIQGRDGTKKIGYR